MALSVPPAAKATCAYRKWKSTSNRRSCSSRSARASFISSRAAAGAPSARSRSARTRWRSIRISGGSRVSCWVCVSAAFWGTTLVATVAGAGPESVSSGLEAGGAVGEAALGALAWAAWAPWKGPLPLAGLWRLCEEDPPPQRSGTLLVGLPATAANPDPRPAAGRTGRPAYRGRSPRCGVPAESAVGWAGRGRARPRGRRSPGGQPRPGTPRERRRAVGPRQRPRARRRRTSAAEWRCVSRMALLGLLAVSSTASLGILVVVSSACQGCGRPVLRLFPIDLGRASDGLPSSMRAGVTHCYDLVGRCLYGQLARIRPREVDEQMNACSCRTWFPTAASSRMHAPDRDLPGGLQGPRAGAQERVHFLNEPGSAAVVARRYWRGGGRRSVFRATSSPGPQLVRLGSPPAACGLPCARR